MKRMLRRLKHKIQLKVMNFKMTGMRKRWIASRNKEAKLHEKFNKAFTNYHYAVQNFNPEKTWEMRSEREGHKINTFAVDEFYLKDRNGLKL